MKIKWQNRPVALEPTALVAVDETAVRLARKLLSLADDKLALLHGVRAEKLILIIGQTEDLPWVDKVVYLGKDKSAPSILLPTNRRPNLPLDLFERTLLHQFSDKLPFAVCEDRIIQTGAARPVARNVLQSWLGKKI